MNNNKTILRAGKIEDAGACGTICYEAFKTIAEQHNFPPDLPNAEMAVGFLAMMLARPDIYSVVAERDGQVVGSNFLWENATIAGVGPITLNPRAQNGGVGRALMENVLERARKQRFAGVRLVQAAYHNRSLSLYMKLGYEAREPLSALQGPPILKTFPAYPVRAASESDLADCNRLCERVHGHERGNELRDAIRQGGATVVEQGGRLVGYATQIGYFGHAVCENNEALKALIAAAPSFVGPGFLLPTRNGDVFRWCLANGLRVLYPMTLMSQGLYSEPAGAFLPSILY